MLQNQCRIMQIAPRLPLARSGLERTIWGMRARRFPWLDMANGTLVVLLSWRWAYYDTRHAILDAATMLTLLIGFVAGATYALLAHRNILRSQTDTERREALLLFPAEGPDIAGVAAPTPVSVTPTDRTAWFTFLVHATLMIALSWRWAYQNEPYTILGAVTLSTLMLGFFRASVSIVERLGHAGLPRHARKNDDQSALLLFPAEDSGTNDLVLSPPLLATHRKALL